jgi:hypothetical protein
MISRSRSRLYDNINAAMMRYVWPRSGYELKPQWQWLVLIDRQCFNYEWFPIERTMYSAGRRNMHNYAILGEKAILLIFLQKLGISPPVPTALYMPHGIMAANGRRTYRHHGWTDLYIIQEFFELYNDIMKSQICWSNTSLAFTWLSHVKVKDQ